LNVLNEVLESGGSDGGMSPGAIWPPFSISSHEYDELVSALSSSSEIASTSRYYTGSHLRIDKAFDSYANWGSWNKAVSLKYGDVGT
jgi:hypothetical protein